MRAAVVSPSAQEEKFIEHVEKRLQKCVEAIESDTSTLQIAQRMKNMIQTSPVYLKELRQIFQSSDVSGTGLLPVDVFAAGAKTIFGSYFFRHCHSSDGKSIY